jgi:lysophospholipase L1-like esterase
MYGQEPVPFKTEASRERLAAPRRGVNMGFRLVSVLREGCAVLNRVSLRVAIGVLAGILSIAVVGQEPGNVPETQAPAPTPATVKHPDNDYWRKHDQQLLTDFPWLERFKEADLKLGPPAANEERVVFMGDSITEGWHFDAPGGVFAAKPYINRGISGQTTPQMVLRFHQDVIALQPKAVVILAGTNDIAGNTGPMTLEETEANIAAMAEMASANQIRIVLCSLLPAYDYPWQPGLTPAPKIDAINAWIKKYAAEHGYVYVDYHSAMKDARDGLATNLSHDGVHPTQAGYDIMAPLAEAGIAKAVKNSGQ